eukprot:scaffold18772_cov112-Isochrysis_galbana.AAC.13
MWPSAPATSSIASDAASATGSSEAGSARPVARQAKTMQANAMTWSAYTTGTSVRQTSLTKKCACATRSRDQPSHPAPSASASVAVPGAASPMVPPARAALRSQPMLRNCETAALGLQESRPHSSASSTAFSCGRGQRQGE